MLDSATIPSSESQISHEKISNSFYLLVKPSKVFHRFQRELGRKAVSRLKFDKFSWQKDLLGIWVHH